MANDLHTMNCKKSAGIPWQVRQHLWRMWIGDLLGRDPFSDRLCWGWKNTGSEEAGQNFGE